MAQSNGGPKRFPPEGPKLANLILKTCVRIPVPRGLKDRIFPGPLGAFQWPKPWAQDVPGRMACCKHPGRACLGLEVFSTASAGKDAANNPISAPIAGFPWPSRPMGCRVVARGIEDYDGNTTRFLVLGLRPSSRSGDDKTSAPAGAQRPAWGPKRGTQRPQRQGHQPAKIESRPMKGKQWEYLFFLDMVGHMEDDNIPRATIQS